MNPIVVCLYMSGNMGGQGTRAPTGAASRDRGTFFLFWRPFCKENGRVESFMRWALMGCFEHSNRELLALHFCRGPTVFVIHKRSQEVPGRPWGVSGTSLGGPRGVPWGPRGVIGDPRGVHRVPMGVPRGSRGSQGAPGTSQAPLGSLS